MQLPTPPGYAAIVPLDREKHGRLGLSSPGNFHFAGGLNIVYLTAVEFFRAAHDFPVAFVLDEAANEYVPVAVTGLIQGENLFVDTQGAWRRGCYIPAYVRRYPFFTVQLQSEGGEDQRMIICVDEAGLSARAEPLFNADGVASEAWQKSEKFIHDMEDARQATTGLVKVLKALDLFEPFEAKVHQQAGEPRNIRGLHRINEEKLNALGGKRIKEMMKHGHLSRIYAHLMSLGNFARLLDMDLTE